MNISTITTLIDQHQEFLSKIETYGTEYAINCNLRHPFKDEYFSGVQEDLSNRRDGWSYCLTDTNIIIYWSIETYSCGSSDTDDYTLKLPLTLFDETLNPSSIEEKLRIDTIKKELATIESELHPLKQEKTTLLKEVGTLDREYSYLLQAHKTITGAEFKDDSLTNIYQTKTSEIRWKIELIKAKITKREEEISLLKEQL